MNLYIETVNGLTKNHPALKENLIEVFGFVPDTWEPFIRIEQPTPSVYQIFDNNDKSYIKVDGVWTDFWSLRNMTNDEKEIKQQKEKERWALLPNRNNFIAWKFDEVTCKYQPPIPRPEVGTFFWQGNISSWVVLPERPNDGKNYKFDFVFATWVEIT
jgi:hypothetical protein